MNFLYFMLYCNKDWLFKPWSTFSDCHLFLSLHQIWILAILTLVIQDWDLSLHITTAQLSDLSSVNLGLLVKLTNLSPK